MSKIAGRVAQNILLLNEPELVGYNINITVVSSLLAGRDLAPLVFKDQEVL
jgi:hypothetical protein